MTVEKLVKILVQMDPEAEVLVSREGVGPAQEFKILDCLVADFGSVELHSLNSVRVFKPV